MLGHGAIGQYAIGQAQPLTSFPIYTYSSWLNSFYVMMGTSANADLSTIIPIIIDLAEQRLYRDLDLLDTQVTTTQTVAAHARTTTSPIPAAGPYVVVDAINILTSTRKYPLAPVSRAVIDWTWPSTAATTGRPAQYAPLLASQQTQALTFTIGPPPDNTYTLEFVGKIRPLPLSASNTTTYLTTHYPDLWVAATMLYGAGYQKNFGAEADDPLMATAWEEQYGLLLDSAIMEESRKRFAAASWTSFKPESAAQPQRG